MLCPVKNIFPFVAFMVPLCPLFCPLCVRVNTGCVLPLFIQAAVIVHHVLERLPGLGLRGLGLGLGLGVLCGFHGFYSLSPRLSGASLCLFVCVVWGLCVWSVLGRVSVLGLGSGSVLGLCSVFKVQCWGTIANIHPFPFHVNLFLKVGNRKGGTVPGRSPGLGLGALGLWVSQTAPDGLGVSGSPPGSMFSFHRTAHSAPGLWHFRQGRRRGGRKVLLLPPPSNSSPSPTSTPPAARTSASVQPCIYWGFATVLGISGTPQTRLCLIRLIPESESDVFFEIPKNRT